MWNNILIIGTTVIGFCCGVTQAIAGNTDIAEMWVLVLVWVLIATNSVRSSLVVGKYNDRLDEIEKTHKQICENYDSSIDTISEDCSRSMKDICDFRVESIEKTTRLEESIAVYCREESGLDFKNDKEAIDYFVSKYEDEKCVVKQIDQQ